MPTHTLYVASSNPGKLRDFATAARSASTVSSGFSIEPMPCLDRVPPPPENEATFLGNARAKAIYYSRIAPGYEVLADDSGLEVDALNGAPGVRSARYAADHGFTATGDADSDNNLLLLQTLAESAATTRTARYRCVLVLARDGAVLLTAEGAAEGRINDFARGTGGFGYDPLFFLPQFGLTMAEIDPETRYSLSHRGLALQRLLNQLQQAISASPAEPSAASR